MIKHALATAIAVSAIAGCTSDELFIPAEGTEVVLDNRVEITGSFCAEKPDDLSSFLKIMIVMDRSNSLKVTDPNNQRITAATKLVENYIESPQTQKLKPGVEFAVIGFYGTVDVVTRDAHGLPGFTDDGRQVIFGVPSLARLGSNTSYQGALAQAFTLLDRDMAQLDDNARERTRYEVIFLSDGVPFPDNCRGEPNSPTAAIRAVGRIASLGALYNVTVHFSTVYAALPSEFDPATAIGKDGSCVKHDPYNDTSPYLTTGESTRAMMQAMAAAGGGTFTQFLNGDSITFAGFEFAESRRLYALSNFMGSNFSARPRQDTLYPDSDRDGLIDDDELIIGTSPIRADTDGDGFDDAIEWRYRLSGFDPLDPTDAACTPLTRVDTDFDGLRDCEEIFLGTNRGSFDTDADSIPDYVEVMFNGNPRSATPTQDRYADDDADGGANADELRWHTDPKVNDVAYRAKFAYQYDQEQLPITTGAACYDFDLSNVRMASTRALPDLNDGLGASKEGTNRIMLYFAQTPYDDPTGEPIYRVACVDGRFVQDRDMKIPASGEFHLEPTRPSDSYKEDGVLRANNDICQASVNQDCGLGTLWCHIEITGACSCCDARNASTDPNDGTNCRACPACSDGIDNDGDGFTDYPYDKGCFDSVDPDEKGESCSDGIDNDGDGFIDFPNDPGCSSGYDNGGEIDPVPQHQCWNFTTNAAGVSVPIDDDGNGVANYPADPNCDSAWDDNEGPGPPACDDGQDNDGDGLVDLLDPGCDNLNDIDEHGPETCFFCERYTDAQPDQCDIGSGLCKPRSGQIPQAQACASNADCGNPVIGEAPCLGGQCVPTAVNAVRSLTNCQNRAQCRGAPCKDVNGNQCLGAGPCNGGLCSPCLQDLDCDTAAGAHDGLCDTQRGWCLTDLVYKPIECTTDANCPTGTCMTDIGVCSVDPYYACKHDSDCRADEVCSLTRGFCLKKVFAATQCESNAECTVDSDGDGQPDGTCNTTLGWCLPSGDKFQCRQDDECPFGNCVKQNPTDVDGYCDQQTFVFPQNFNPAVDCIRGR